MPSFDADSVAAVLREFQDPETGRGIGSLGQLKQVRITDDLLAVDLGLTSWSAPLADETRQACEALLKSSFPNAREVEVKIVPHERPADKIGQIGLTAKSVIAVGSGKGGVGKSTLATMIALGLKREGCKVGIMDADVYGPSVPHLLGVTERPTAIDNRLQPIDKEGLKVMSMGLLVPAGEAIVWRGPMLHGAVTQFLRDTNWGDLDYLIIDMPPGTGDIALTLSQLLPLTGAVVVCTPQDVALLDAVKAIAMFRKVNIPLLGLVENMSYFLCPDNNKRYDIFGCGGAKAKAAELSVPFLGDVPINIDLRKRGDDGVTDGNYDDEAVAKFFQDICRNVVRNVATARALSPPLPSLPVL
jgi:ATP-binding protein involved in chromosome partitioning